jgi:hypothetical protein
MAIPDAATVADRWVGAAGAAQARFTEGVQTTTKDPTALAVAQISKLQNNFVQSVTSGRWQRNLQRVGKTGWQSATVAKASNFSTGVNAAKDKYMAAMGPVLQIEAQVQAQVQAMPKATLQDSINRMTTWATALHNWKLNR